MAFGKNICTPKFLKEVKSSETRRKNEQIYFVSIFIASRAIDRNQKFTYEVCWVDDTEIISVMQKPTGKIFTQDIWNVEFYEKLSNFIGAVGSIKYAIHTGE